MKLYYKKGACSLAVHLLINSLNLPCEYIAVDLATKKTESGADFYAVNPKGAVPCLVLDDGTVFTENAIIQQYLVDAAKAYTLLPAVGDNNRYHILAWLNYASTELHKGCSPLFNPKVPDQVKKEVFLPAVDARVKFLDAQLEKHTFIFGDTLTLPDFYIFTVLRWVPHLGVKLDNYPHVSRYVAKMNALPAVQRTLQEEGLSA